MLVKIKDICQVVSGATPATKIPSYYDGNVYWITPKDLADNGDRKYIDDCSRKITESGYNSCSTAMIPKNNILISTRAPIGYIAINTMECCTNQGFKSLICDTSKVNVDYLYYLLKSRMHEIELLGSGTTFKEVSKTSIENFEIDLFFLDIQKKIASILSSIDAQIERNNAMAKRLQVLGKTVYSKKITNCLFDKMSLNAVITTGKEDANHAKINGKYKFFTCGDNSLMCDDFKFEGKSVLVSGNGNFNVKYYDGKFNAYQRTYIVKNDKIIGNLYYTLLFNTELFRKKSNGSIIKFITIDMLKKIDVPIFPNEINNALNKILSKINEIQSNTFKLNNFKEILIPILINGQLQ